MKTVGLALGGGAVRGLAHIGVLKVLKDNQFPIDYISGTSMGGAIGGLMCAGIEIEEIEEFVMTLPTIRNIEFAYGTKSILGGNKIYMMLLHFLEQKGLEDFQIEYSKIPYSAVSVDLLKGEEYLFDHGSLGIALRATTAVPGVFAPVHYKDMVLVDGGVLNNLPADIVRASGVSLVVAVDVGREFHGEPKSMFDILYRSAAVMMNHNVRINLSCADLVMRPDVGQYGSFDLKKIRQCIEAGKLEAEAQLPRLMKLFHA